MKRFFKLFAFCAVAVLASCLVFSSCSCKKTVDPVEPSFTDVIVEDFGYAQSFATEENEVRFYEVETVLSNVLGEVPADSVFVAKSATIFAVADTVYTLIHDFTTGETLMEKVEGHWVGSANIDSLDIKVGFEQALKLLYETTELEIPASDKMTFRTPLNGVNKYPLYIFGSHNTNFVYVDSYTGEMGNIE